MDIRVIVLGDSKFYLAQVGKTTFIKGLINDSSSEDQIKVYQPVKLPQDQCISECSITIIDSFLKSQNKLEDALENEILKSNVILLLIDISSPNSIKRLSSFWLKTLNKLTRSPIIILANKIDLKPEHPEYFLDAVIQKLTLENSLFDCIFECSGLNLDGVLDVFVAIQKVVLFPVAPLFDSASDQLSPGFLRALRLVFRRIDRDKDGYLSVDEMRDMQIEVFQQDIDEESVNSIFDMVKEVSSDGILERKMNFKGFSVMQLMMIHQMKTEICWKMLRHYGFNKELKIEVNTIDKKNCLSKSSFVFLLGIFDQFSENNRLTQEGLLKVFEACPHTPEKNDLSRLWFEFKEKVEVVGSASQESWVAYWVLLSYQSNKTCAEFLHYIGISSLDNSIFCDGEENISVVNLVGINKVGKTWVSDILLKKQTNDYTPTSQIKSSCLMTKQDPIPWLSKFLIIKEIPLIEVEDYLKALDSKENLALITNENPQSKEIADLLNLNQFKNFQVIKNEKKSLTQEDLPRLLYSLPSLKPEVEKGEPLITKTKKYYFLAAVILLISIITIILI